MTRAEPGQIWEHVHQGKAHRVKVVEVSPDGDYAYFAPENPATFDPCRFRASLRMSCVDGVPIDEWILIKPELSNGKT